MASISLSRANSLDPAKQRSFSRYDPLTAKAFIKAITENIWSPIIWTEGIRLKSQYASCAYAVLDFDTGRPTVKEVINEMEALNVAYILGLTKSHQKSKVTPTGATSPPVDRFRLILKMDKELKDRELYEYNMALFASYFGSDSSCTDAARFYYPCTTVAGYRNAGNTVGWRGEYDSDYVPEEKRYARRRERLKELGETGTLPTWILAIMDGKTRIEPGERHKTCYRIGAVMAAMGIAEAKIVGMVMATGLSEIGEEDIWRAVRNGIAAEIG